MYVKVYISRMEMSKGNPFLASHFAENYDFVGNKTKFNKINCI